MDDQLVQKIDEMLSMKLNGFMDRIVEMLDEVQETLDVHTRKFEEIDKRFERIDKRFEQIDKILNEHTAKFSRINKVLDEHSSKIDSLTLSVIRIENTLEGYNDMYKLNEEKIAKLDNRIGRLEKRSSASILNDSE